MKYTFAISISFLLSLNLTGQGLTIDEKVDSVLNLMTLAEKVGQMTQVERNALVNINDIATYNLGSLLSGGGSSPTPNTQSSWANMYDNFQSIALQSNLGIPIIYGVDAVHGHNNVHGAVIFPHNIGIGCTWNPDLVRDVNEIVAKEVAATGIDWTFSPCIAVPQDEKWGRTYEGFGETAEIQKIMAEESVVGLQGSDLSANETILACAKHFVGDGGTLNGVDQGNTVVSEQVLRDLHMPGYIDAIESGVGSAMASYNSWNGVKLHGHQYLLTDVLKVELGFEGFVISDWKGVDQLHGDYREAIKMAINAGIDMVMVPDRYEEFIAHLISLVQDNEVSEDRIDDAVKRILKQKFLLDLFDNPYTDASLAGSFGSQAHRDVGRQAVRESLVLLNAKNDVLPIQKNDQTILVAGSLAADLGAQCGGWTISWQGGNGNITIGTDILSGIQNAVGTSNVIYSPTGNYTEPVDVAVVVVGEKVPYAEGAGYRTDLDLDDDDVNLIKALKEDGIPTIALLVSGRPMVIGEMLPYTDATMAVWYPGTEGDGIAEVLFGDFDPSGQLTHSWPKNNEQVPINLGDVNYDPLFAYKHGFQDFPEAISSDSLLPYAAVTNTDGSTISFTLSDKVTSVNYNNNDFIFKINDIIVPNFLNNIAIATFDESILHFDLNSQIDQSASITISYVGNGISSSNLELSKFVDFYVHNISNNAGGTNYIPGRVEAEDYFDMYGIQTEPCQDLGGGINVGWIEAGDWMKYNVEVTQTGQYEITSRISGYNVGTLLILFNETLQVSVDYISTNGWQNWEDFTSEVYLEEGNYVMKALAQSDAFNINYFAFEKIGGIDLDLKVFLEGPFEGSQMTTGLNINNAIPLSQPYNQPPWNYSGNENVYTLLNNEIVDWVYIQLRDAPGPEVADSSTIIEEKAAFLLSNGSIVGLDGSSVLRFPTAFFLDNLYVVVLHRNHLGIMSANGLTESGGVYNYNFTSSLNQVYNGSSCFKQLATGVYGMVAGDSNADGVITNADNVQWKSDAGKKSYISTDYNLDTQVNNQDKNGTWIENNSYSSQVPY